MWRAASNCIFGSLIAALQETRKRELASDRQGNSASRGYPKPKPLLRMKWVQQRASSLDAVCDKNNDFEPSVLEEAQLFQRRILRTRCQPQDCGCGEGQVGKVGRSDCEGAGYFVGN